MNVTDLIQAGYRPFEDTFKSAKMAYQKRVGWTRYFINVYHYDREFWERISPGKNIPDDFECDLQFQLVEDDYINLEFNCTKLTVAELEAKVEKLFTVLEALPYED